MNVRPDKLGRGLWMVTGALVIAILRDFARPSAYSGACRFPHHPTFPREATCGDFFYRLARVANDYRARAGTATLSFIG